MTRSRARVVALVVAVALVAATQASAQSPSASPSGQLTWASHVTLAPTWFDPAETPGIITPFMILYALHDALVKPMPGNPMAPSLAESWTVSPDGLNYEFVLRLRSTLASSRQGLVPSEPAPGVTVHGVPGAPPTVGSAAVARFSLAARPFIMAAMLRHDAQRDLPGRRCLPNQRWRRTCCFAASPRFRERQRQHRRG